MKKKILAFCFAVVSSLSFAAPKTVVYHNETYENLVNSGNEEYIGYVVDEISSKGEDLSAEDRFWLGVACFYLEQDAKALEHFSFVIENEPEAVDAYYYAGGIYYYAQDYENASKYYSKVLDLDKKNSRAAHYLGLICYEKGDSNAAAEFFDKCYKIEKDAMHAYYVGLCCIDFDDSARAENILSLHWPVMKLM